MGVSEELRGRCRRNCVRRISAYGVRCGQGISGLRRGPTTSRELITNVAGISGHRPDGKRSEKLPAFIKDGS